MTEKIYTAREVLTYLLSEASKWDEDVDGDARDDGTPVVYVNHDIRIRDELLAELLDMAGIKRARYDESAIDALKRATDEDNATAVAEALP